MNPIHSVGAFGEDRQNPQPFVRSENLQEVLFYPNIINTHRIFLDFTISFHQDK